MSGGEQQRDFLPVETLAAMLVQVALAGKALGVVNLCSGTPTAVKDLVGTWLRQAAQPPTLSLGHYPYPDYEPMAFWGDRTRWNSLMAPAHPHLAKEP
jgi:dTDP-6-deoxy-L-talose 4-dehydrogenase (NAD+)